MTPERITLIDSSVCKSWWDDESIIEWVRIHYGKLYPRHLVPMLSVTGHDTAEIDFECYPPTVRRFRAR